MGIKRKSGVFDIFTLNAGSMISSGLFILPGLVYLKTGSASFIAYFIAGLLVIPTLLSQMELSSAMPKTGRENLFFNRSLGSGLSTLNGMAAWFTLLIKSAFALLGFGTLLTILFPSIDYNQVKLISLFFCMLFLVINLINTKHVQKLQAWLVVGLIIILALFLFFGSGNIKLDNFSISIHSSTRDLFAAVGLIFIAYSGLTRPVSTIESKRNYDKKLTVTIILTFLIIVIIYTLVVFVTVGVLGDNIVKANGSATLTPISDAARTFGGQTGMFFLAIAALIAFISSTSAGITAAFRIPYAMSHAKLLPVFFSRINKDYQTPHLAIAITVFFMAIAILFLDLETLVKTGSTICLILFSLKNLSVVILRESHIQNYQPECKSPLFPWLQIIAILIYFFLIFEMGALSLMISGIFMLFSLIWYLLYAKIHSNRNDAILNLIRKVKSSELDFAEPDKELRDIILKTDSLLQDRFYHLIESCPVIDIQNKETREEFFARIAKELNSTLDCGEREIFNKLIICKDECSSVISQDLAISHIILPEEKGFEILFARTQQGVYFAEDFPNVKIIIIIAGSKDDRCFHLLTLAKIAQIVHQSDFIKKLLKAQNVDALRNIILNADDHLNHSPVDLSGS